MSKIKKVSEKDLDVVNIGLFGHVDSGKTTLTEAITGRWTDVHSEEIKKGITIRLGYAESIIYKCNKCREPNCYSTFKKCPTCFGDTLPQRYISLVDAPGHNALMATVLSGTSLIDGAILVISATEECPQPQTIEHLTALSIVDIKNIIIVQNKIDEVSKEQLLRNYKQIKDFIKGTIAENAPIIPVSAIQKINIDALLQAIQEEIPTPKRDVNSNPKMFIARSFDVNKPGTSLDKLTGGVIGGSLIKGKLKVGDKIEIRPGVKIKNDYQPIKTEISMIQKFGRNLKEVEPGGLIALGTKLDPSLTKSDFLTGNIVGFEGKLPPVRNKLLLEVNLLDEVVGEKISHKVSNIASNEILMITSGVGRTVGLVNSSRENEIEINLRAPVCAENGEKIVLFRQISGRWRLIGYGIIK